MKSFGFVTNFQRKIESINGQNNPLRSEDFVWPTEMQNALIVSQQNGVSDVAICLQQKILQEFADRNYPEDFSFDDLPALSVLIEEISHFSFFCEKSRVKQEISPLDMEIQAEVDKFSFVLHCLEEMERANERHFVYEVLFENPKLGDWVPERDKGLYLDANQIAKNFCRSFLKEEKALREARDRFQSFFSMSPSEKRKLML